MKYILTILTILLYHIVFCQSAQWTTGDERSIFNYEVQDSITEWVTIAQVPKGKSSYTFPVTIFPAWYRIKAKINTDKDTSFFTIAKYIAITNGVTITNPVFHTTSLTWTTANEKNVSYYFLQKTRNNVTTKVNNYGAKGGGNYKYYMARTVYKYKYTIRAVFKDTSLGAISTFK